MSSASAAPQASRTLWSLVLNWNGLADTRRLLPSLLACRMPAGWRHHLLVIDNGSTDGSVATLRTEFRDVEWLELPDNRMFAGGNNAGLSHALAHGADAVMLINNDTQADPGLCEHLLLALEQEPRAGAAAPLIYFGAPTRRIWYAGGRCLPALGHASHRGLRALDEGQWRVVEDTGYCTGCCVVALRAVWEQVGGLDERYYLYAEDADWSLRVRAAGLRLLFVPTARLWHEVSASSGASSPWKIYQRLRANWRLFATHSRGLGALTWLPAFLAQQVVLAAWLAARGHLAAALAVPRALFDAVRGRSPREVKP
ncbi:MAG: glycosyltransferase family 2 protein [Candidatus Eisenbacteria bacterium]|uniref:Glycosyltransferase family 2 protein n=1 Tax=Eiseniibacteriota bacterium TaxID=2212470 RepID=A0A849SL75_UNCEI|nr:glycosyltransferase family 2 protein [Candidatus Eisenbacteria bacterium]